MFCWCNIGSSLVIFDIVTDGPPAVAAAWPRMQYQYVRQRGKGLRDSHETLLPHRTVTIISTNIIERYSAQGTPQSRRLDAVLPR
jgi:hypothetical protein